MVLIVAIAVISGPFPLFADSKWVRLRSPHFELLSGAGASSGREVLRRMEQIRHVFETRTRQSNLTPLPVRIYVFRNESEFHPFQINENVAGYYQAGNDRDYIAMQVTGGDLYRVVFHEYVHLLMRHAGIAVPVWFNEGTAEVYSTTELSGHEIRIGEPIPAHLATLRTERLLDLPTLLSVDHNSPHYNERSKTGIFYAQSWALVHMLNFSPDYQPGMPNFLTMLFTGEEPGRALQQAFGKSPATVLNDLTSYVRRDRFAGIRFAAPKLEGMGKLPAEPMGDVDSDLALASLLIALNRPDQAEAIIAKLAVARPDNPELAAALGETAVQKKQDQVARKYYERAMALGSRSARLRYDYAMLLRELNAGDEAIITALREAVKLDPKLFEARYLLGYTLLKIQKYPEAIDELTAASELQPYRSAIWEHLALAYHYSKKKDDALNAARRARRLAATPEEIDRAEGTLKLVESNADSIVHAEPMDAAVHRPALAGSDNFARVEGLLMQVDCLGSKARLHVASNGRKTFLLVKDPGSVVLRNSGGVWTEFSCGAVNARAVIVDYRKAVSSTYGTAGDVAAIEFR